MCPLIILHNIFVKYIMNIYGFVLGTIFDIIKFFFGDPKTFPSIIKIVDRY